jgi:hypothetical protein
MTPTFKSTAGLVTMDGATGEAPVDVAVPSAVGVAARGVEAAA